MFMHDSIHGVHKVPQTTKHLLSHQPILSRYYTGLWSYPCHFPLLSQ